MTELLFLPGMLNDARLWRSQQAALADRWPIRNIDLTGADRITDLAAGILKDIPERCVLIGLSMGGYVALELVRQLLESGEGDRLAGLVLVATSARADTSEQQKVRAGLLDLARRGRFKGVTPQLLPTLLHPDHAHDDTIAATVFTMADDIGREGFIRQETAVMHRRDQRDLLPEISCPTLILCGDHDRRTPPECSEELHAGIQDSRYHLLTHCGHLPPLERAERVTELLNGFLASIRP